MMSTIQIILCLSTYASEMWLFLLFFFHLASELFLQQNISLEKIYYNTASLYFLVPVFGKGCWEAARGLAATLQGIL